LTGTFYNVGTGNNDDRFVIAKSKPWISYA
jgi:hypothetical protein